MYVGEFLLWFGSAMKAETRKKLKMGYTSGDMTLKEVQKDYTQESVSNNPRPIGPYYAYNDSYLEIRGGMFENFRGILTWISLLIFMIPYVSWNLGFEIALNIYNHEDDGIISGIFFIITYLIITVILSYLLIRYFRYIYRFELFTIRHIRVRFNRVTK